MARIGDLDKKRALDVEHRLMDDAGRILLAAISNDARSMFENDAGVEYPVGRIGRIVTPFDRLLEWMVTGRVSR